ncbi:transaldolase [Chitinivorax sp. PXF-14]|uniref:transaldolase n=1 Tax=Chitinivorax sp. PXF-14 TaxID=3230488 RepID=UPI00346526F6
MSRLIQIRNFGQRVWLDNLSRQLVAEQLSNLVAEDGIAGVTSNPAIFYNAIAKDGRYQGDLARLKTENLSAEQRYEALVIPDIQAACDLMRTQYDATAKADGYVSFEVSPFLANDEAGTLVAARRLWQAVDRPNLMIKVPATAAGTAAFEQLIAEGLNVNITLMFSPRHVETIFDAYLRGLQRRVQQGLPVDHIKAVASVFMSRVDTLIDKKLDAIGSADALALRGKAAVAFARTAYHDYQTLFHGARFAELKAAGARPQCLLWASTGTKNAAYSDVLYIEELIGDETVNTAPDATLDAFRDHGQAAATLGQGLPQAEQTVAALAALGIDLNEVGEQLQQEGLKLFDDAFEKLLALTA